MVQIPPGLAAADQPLVGCRLHRDRLFQEALEELASGSGSSAVEVERELVEVVLQMRETDGALVSAEQPALEQRRHQVHSGQKFGRRAFAPLQHRDLVLIPFRLQPRIAFPPIRVPEPEGQGLPRLLTNSGGRWSARAGNGCTAGWRWTRRVDPADETTHMAYWSQLNSPIRAISRLCVSAQADRRRR